MIFLSILCLECLWEHEELMKKKLFTLLLSAAAVALICNCGDDAVINADNNSNSSRPIIVSQPSFLYRDGDTNYIIDAYGFVTNEAGDTIALADIATGLIVALDSQRTIIAQNVNFAELEILSPTIITETAWVLHADKNYVIHPMNQHGVVIVTDASGAAIGSMIFKTGSDGVPTTVGDIVDLKGNVLVGNVDLNDLNIYQPNTNPVPVPVESSSSNDNPGPGPVLTSSSSVENPGNSSSSKTNSTSSSSKTKSSSSAAKSSSSSAKSSSSSAKSSSSNGGSGGCPTIKTKSGGATGSGWATRYWDCCMPHCSWPEHGGQAKVCDSRGKNPIGNGSGSVCSNGAGAACTSQIPFTVDGCEEYGFAFAAVPASNGGQCGKCFQLTFTGEGHYSSTNGNTRKLKNQNKKLIIMVTNIGGDVNQGQFDIMIPGGGVGLFNGCANMGWGAQGEQYGGLLSDCEKETNYSAGKYASCLTEKCNKSFANDEEAKKGCLFLATWMNAAGNPEHNYVEVECPEVLKNKY